MFVVKSTPIEIKKNSAYKKLIVYYKLLKNDSTIEDVKKLIHLEATSEKEVVLE